MRPGRSAIGSLRNALSVSLPVRALLSARAHNGRVLGVFDRACVLDIEGAGPIALVLDEIGDGPLNIVIEGQPGSFLDLAAADPVRTSQGAIAAGSLSVGLQTASIWDPRPRWQSLRSHKEAILGNLAALQATALRLAPPGTLLDLVRSMSDPGLQVATIEAEASSPKQTTATLTVARKAAQALARGWAGSQEDLRTGAAALAGLGQGLTPAGDDFLMGVMLGAWLIHDEPEAMCGRVLASVEGRSTALSAAFLEAAARGECSAAWHRLFDVMVALNEDRLEPATQAILIHGSTSGSDTLAGFLYLNRAASVKRAE